MLHVLVLIVLILVLVLPPKRVALLGQVVPATPSFVGRRPIEYLAPDNFEANLNINKMTDYKRTSPQRRFFYLLFAFSLTTSANGRFSISLFSQLKISKYSSAFASSGSLQISSTCCFSFLKAMIESCLE